MNQWVFDKATIFSFFVLDVPLDNNIILSPNASNLLKFINSKYKQKMFVMSNDISQPGSAFESTLTAAFELSLAGILIPSLSSDN